jgi:ubiquinone/menaquinone biosynthesis C-methylase UbiE
MRTEIWDFWAKKYDRLWVQKYSLKPTRDYITNAIEKNRNNEAPIRLLDVGCGPGELLEALENKFDHIEMTGIDFSKGMLEVSQLRNQKATHIKMDVADISELKDKFNIIVCTHSLPYYKEPRKFIKDLHNILEDDGKIYMGFASGNNFYDRFILGMVKMTTGPANYMSDDKYKKHVQAYFQIENLKIIKEIFFMPRIAIYTLRKVNL